MAEKMTDIGGRLHDTSGNHIVAGANEIFDDDLAKRQSEFNAEQVTINQNQDAINQSQEAINDSVDVSIENLEEEVADRYTKEEINNILSNTEKTDSVIVDIGEADMIELVPSDTMPNTVFNKDGDLLERADATIKKYSIIPGWTYYFTDKFDVGFNYYYVSWWDENGEYISKVPYAGSPSVAREYIEQPVTAPANAKYLYLNTQDSMQSEVEASIFTANEGSIEDIPAALEGLIPNIIDPETGKSSRANKLYRVRRPSNTGSSEWAWNGYKWVWFGNNDYGIDDEPTPGSENMLTSGGASKYTGKYVLNNTGLIDAFTDKEGRIYLGFYDNGDAVLPGLGMENAYDTFDRLEIIKDPKGRIVSSRKKDGTLVEYAGEFQKMYIEELSLGDGAAKSIKGAVGGSSANTLTDPDNWVISFDEKEKMIVDKINSMVYLQWIPKRDCPTRNISSSTDNVFPQGVPVIGVPYSATYNIDKVIGFDVSLETFMTAVNNPFSLLYTEIVCNTNAKSDWGIIYHGVDTYVGPYFGNICSSFTSYCTGLPEAFRTEEYLWLNLVNVIGKILPNNAQSVKVGDFIYKSGHVAIVKAIKCDDNGAISEIIVSEQGGNKAYEQSYTEQEFNEIRIKESSATLYRYPTPNKDMQFFTFDADNYVYNNDICTFAGDKACFREGELIVLNYNLDNRQNFPYTQIELYKDDNESPVNVYIISEIVQSELPEDQRGHALKLADGLEYGDYKAYVSDGVNRSAFTEFKVIQTEVSYKMYDANGDEVEHGRTVKVSFASANATPVSIKVSDYRGVVQGVYIITEEDIEKGYAIIDIDYFLTQATYKSNKIENGVASSLKVFFKDGFGRVTNTPMEIIFEW